MHYLVNHSFLPPKLPQNDDYQIELEHYLCEKVKETINAYMKHVPQNQQAQWSHVSGMLSNLCMSQKYNQLSMDTIKLSIKELCPGGMSF